MFAMSYLNLQMFWPWYIHYYGDMTAIKCGHRTGYAWQQLENKPTL